MGKKRRKTSKHHIFNDVELTEPDITYSSMVWYCVNCNALYHFVNTDKVKYLPEFLIEDMKPEYIRLYNILHRFDADDNDQKVAIADIYNRLSKMLPDMVYKVMESETECRLTVVKRYMSQLDAGGYISSDLWHYIKELDEEAPEYDIVLPYIISYIINLISHKENMEQLLKKIIYNKEQCAEFISIVDRNSYINEMWEICFHTPGMSTSILLFDQFIKLLKSSVMKSDYEYCMKNFKMFMGNISITHCIDYLSTNKKKK